MPKSRWLRCFLPVAALGALLALALFFYPELLRLVSPKGYTALALARSGATLSRETEFLRGAWGTDAWAALARESSLSVAELTVTGAADTLSGTASPLPDGLGLRAETFLNRTAGGLASRQILSWGASDFALDVWLSEEELAVSVPQLFHRPIAFEADRFGLMWNDSPLAALFPLPDGLAADGLGLRASDTLETDPLADWRGRLETLAKSADFEAAETDGAGSRIRAALPQAEAGAFLGETLALCRSLTPFEALPGGAETWAELLDGWETVTPTSGEAVFSIDGGHRLRQLTLTVVGDEDALTFSLWLSGETALLDLVSAEITRTRGEQTTALLRLLVSGLVTPSEEGQMTAEVFVDLSYPLGGHTYYLGAELGLSGGADNLALLLSWDEARAALRGSYAADPVAGRVTVTADTLAFGDGTAWFEVDWTGRWDWRVTGDEPDWAAPPGDALALNDLSRFDWAALLGNFYQLFLGSPLYDPGF